MSKKKIKRPQQYRKPQERTFKEWWAGQSDRSRKTIIGVCAAIVALILLLVIWYNWIYDDGSLRVSDNAIVGMQDDWLVGQRSSGKNSRYYHFADVAVPEGYTAEDSGLVSSLRTDFSFANADESITLYVAAVNSVLSDMPNTVHEQMGRMVGENGSVGEIVPLETNLGKCRYFTYDMTSTNEAGEESYAKSLVLYAPCAYGDSCILISATQHADSPDAYLADDALLAEAQKAAAAITVTK